MTREQVDALLLGYHEMVGRCGHIGAEIASLEQKITGIREEFERDAAAPAISRIDGMPRGTTLSDPTQCIALKLADGEAYRQSDAYRRECALRDEIAALERERAEKRLRIQYVDSWLSGLADRERWVIERHLIDGDIWHDIITPFNRRYDDDVTKDRLKRIQQKALEKIYGMAA